MRKSKHTLRVFSKKKVSKMDKVVRCEGLTGVEMKKFHDLVIKSNDLQLVVLNDMVSSIVAARRDSMRREIHKKLGISAEDKF